MRKVEKSVSDMASREIAYEHDVAGLFSLQSRTDTWSSAPPALRSRDEQNETEQPDHSANLSASVKMKFSVQISHKCSLRVRQSSTVCLIKIGNLSRQRGRQIQAFNRVDCCVIRTIKLAHRPE